MIFCSVCQWTGLRGNHFSHPSPQQVLNKPTMGGVSACFVWLLVEVMSAPTRFHRAGGSVRGIKDAASWRMAGLCCWGAAQLLYIWQQRPSKRRRLSIDVRRRCLHCSCSVYRLLMERLVAACVTHVVKDDSHTEERKQHIQTQLMKHVCCT